MGRKTSRSVWTEPRLRAQDLGFELFDASRHGKFSLIKLKQTYREYPVLGPEAELVLSGPGRDVTSIHGTIVDGALSYANLDAQCPEWLAARALRKHATTRPEDAAAATLHAFGLYAQVPSQRMVCAADVAVGGILRGRFAVDAALVTDATLPRLVYAEDNNHAGLDDEIKITALGHDLATSPYPYLNELALTPQQATATGSPLVGSTWDGEIQLANPRVFVRDLKGQTMVAGLLSSSRLVSAKGEFIIHTYPEFTAQRTYHLFQGFYEIADRYLSTPTDPAIKQWDSHLGHASSFAPGTYEPRVGLFTTSGERCNDQPACAGSFKLQGEIPAGHPELVHLQGKITDDSLLESIGFVNFLGDASGLVVIAHEFGHIIDAFLFPGMPSATTCILGIDCEARCVEDTPDEAPALKEMVANLIALLPDMKCDGGGSKLVPTGACSASLGYRANSTLEAFWQLLTGRVCAPEPPYACTSIALGDGIKPSEAAARALFFALRANARSYRQLFEHMASFYACEYGVAAFTGVACDRNEVLVSCADLGFVGGELTCSSTCELVVDGCVNGVPTTTSPIPTEGYPGPVGDDSTGPGESSVSGGYGCHQSSDAPGLGFIALLGTLGFTVRTRQRSHS